MGSWKSISAQLLGTLLAELFASCKKPVKHFFGALIVIIYNTMSETGCEFYHFPKWNCLFLTPLFKGFRSPLARSGSANIGHSPVFFLLWCSLSVPQPVWRQALRVITPEKSFWARARNAEWPTQTRNTSSARKDSPVFSSDPESGAIFLLRREILRKWSMKRQLSPCDPS